jgi:hypothetical protein
LEGTRSNRIALNARVKTTAGDLVQAGEILSGGSYLSQDDLRIHLGLGSRERVDRVEISWPTGKTETLADLAAARFYDVKEGQGVASVERSKRPTPKH